MARDPRGASDAGIRQPLVKLPRDVLSRVVERITCTWEDIGRLAEVFPQDGRHAMGEGHEAGHP